MQFNILSAEIFSVATAAAAAAATAAAAAVEVFENSRWLLIYAP